MKKYVSVLLVFVLLLSLVGCSVDPAELGDVLVDAAKDKASEMVDNTIEGVKEETTNLWEIYVVNPLSDAWNSITSLFAPKVTEKDGKYYEGGELIANVTFDTIAEAEFRKDFDSCNKKQRKEVIRLYAIYSGYGENDVVLEFVSKIDPEDTRIDWENWDEIEDAMILGSTDFALVKLYAEAKNNVQIEQFFDKLSNGAGVAENIYQVVKTIFLIKDLTNNDISDPEEYCIEFIAVLDSLTSFIDPTGYFSAGLTVVSDGVELLIELYEERYDNIYAYGDSMDGEGIFIGKRWRIVAHPSRWEEQFAAELAGEAENPEMPYLSLKDIQTYHADLDSIETDTERKLVEKYIAFRIEHELTQDIG